MDEEDFSDDTSDEDYIPTENAGLSEEEDSGDEELPLDDETEIDSSCTSVKRKRATKKSAKSQKGIIPRKRKGWIQLEKDKAVLENEGCSSGQGKVQECEDGQQLTELVTREEKEKRAEKEKSKVDLLWADFMKDVSSTGHKSKVSTSAESCSSKTNTTTSSSSTVTSSSDKGRATETNSGAKQEKVLMIREFNFAGETVQVPTLVRANSKEAKQQQAVQPATVTSTSSTASSTSTPAIGIKRPVGGLSSVLGKLDKRPKMSTLVKSKLDWDTFKSAEGIDDELKIHNRGKDGYLERQAFLERTDHRQFEIEKSIRLGAKRK